MEANETSYLIFVLAAFAALMIVIAVGIIKYHAWRARRGTSQTGAASGAEGSTPPSYPRHDHAPHYEGVTRA